LKLAAIDQGILWTGLDPKRFSILGTPSDYSKDIHSDQAGSEGENPIE